jgi:Fe-S-cluster containining protein
VDFTYPNNIRFDCNRCGLCCGDTKQKTRRILLLENEVKQIASQTAKAIADFSVEIGDKPPYSYEMKKTSEGKCIFLKENQCTIYPLRALICMFYPFQLTFDKTKDRYIFDFTFECPEINQGRVLSQGDFERLFGLAQERLP